MTAGNNAAAFQTEVNLALSCYLTVLTFFLYIKESFGCFNYCIQMKSHEER